MEKTTQHLELILKYFDDFTALQLEQLAALDTLYKEWNSKINVISRKDIEGLYEKHVLHSLAIAAGKTFRAGSEVLDIGTGGGFPGIPLAIIFPEVQFHLADSIGKKIKVVEEVKKAIGLKNITTQQIRVEEIKNRKFDYAVSRAVAPLKDLWNWTKPLLRKGSQASKVVSEEHYAPGLVCLKGGDLSTEIAACRAVVTGIEIFEFFPESFFREKYLLHVQL